MTPNQVTAGEVLFYVPNIIGYCRIACTILSLILIVAFPQFWIAAVILYVSSFVGDLFDGLAARKFSQCSTFGGLLDMVTDRCSTTGFLCALSKEYSHKPILVLTFTFLILLDISSHWCQMYSTTSMQLHHKSAEGNKGRFFLVRWYYLSYPFFGYCCIGAELTYVALFILSKVRNDKYETLETLCVSSLMFLIPACVIKQVVNFSQLCSSCYAVAAHDAALKNKR